MMFRFLVCKIVLPLAAVFAVSSALGQPGADAEQRLAAQRAAMARLAFMDGAWEGTATIASGPGAPHELRQFERVGPMLDGTIRLIEGRGLEADGTLSFNAFAIVSYDVAREAYSMRSYSGGYAGDYAFTPTEDGFRWEIPAGEATIRFTAVFKDDHWHEVGERLVPGEAPRQFIEMKLTRTGDASWQAE
jgi:hypothetical protein